MKKSIVALRWQSLAIHSRFIFKQQKIILSTWKFRVGESLDINLKISYLYGKIMKFLHIVFSLCSERSNKLQLSILSPHLNKLNTVTLLEKVYIYLRFLKAKNLWDDISLMLFTRTNVLHPIPHNIPAGCQEKNDRENWIMATMQIKLMAYTLHNFSVVDVIILL